MAKAPKMTNLLIEETSGVDHPAHLHEGWLVIKSADAETVADETEGAKEEPMPEQDEHTPEASEPTVESLTDALAKAEEQIADLEARLADAAVAEVVAEDAPAESEDDLLKAAPESVIKMVEDLRKEREDAIAKAAAAEAELRKERETAADAAAVEKAREAYSHLQIDVEKFGPAMRRLAEFDADLAKSVEGALAAADAQNESGAIFAEMGKSAPATGSAYERLTALAKSLVTDGAAPTVEQAFADVTKSNPDLYAEYLAEKGA